MMLASIFPVRFFLPVQSRPAKCADAAVVTEREVFNVRLFGAPAGGVCPGPALVKMPVPRTGRDDKASLPSGNLVFSPSPRYTCG